MFVLYSSEPCTNLCKTCCQHALSCRGWPHHHHGLACFSDPGNCWFLLVVPRRSTELMWQANSNSLGYWPLFWKAMYRILRVQRKSCYLFLIKFPFRKRPVLILEGDFAVTSNICALESLVEFAKSNVRASRT